MIEYDEDWLCPLIFRRAGSVGCRACCFAAPAAFLTFCLLVMDEFFPQMREKTEFRNLSSSIIWSAASGLLMFLIGLRTRDAYSRFWEGTGLLHQMRGEWFDTVSNCVTFSIKAKRGPQSDKVVFFRHTLVRLMSLAHGNALEEISGDQFEVESIDVHGLDSGTLRHLKQCHEKCHFNKVEVILHLIQSLIVSAHFDGILDIPPPILSRVFQTISRGFVNLLNAKKITDTRFPFPFVQLIAILMLGFTILTPVLLSSFISNWTIAVVSTFIPVFAVASLNAISQELENPFGEDDNDLPINHFQEEMNNCLLMLLHPNADLIAHTGKNIELDFEQLLHKFSSKSPEYTSHRLSRSQSNDSMRSSRRVSRFEGFLDVDIDIDKDEVQSNASLAGADVKSTVSTNVNTSAPPESTSRSSLQGTPKMDTEHNLTLPDILSAFDKCSRDFVKSLGSLTQGFESEAASNWECTISDGGVETTVVQPEIIAMTPPRLQSEAFPCTKDVRGKYCDDSGRCKPQVTSHHDKRFQEADYEAATVERRKDAC